MQIVTHPSVAELEAFASPALVPLIDKHDLAELKNSIRTGERRLVKWPQGLLLLERRTGNNGKSRMVIAGISAGAVLLRRWLPDLFVIASSWGCDEIETMAYDPRLARAILRVGAKAEAVNLVLKVEASSGQQEED